MRTSLRSLSLGIATMLGMAAFAQPLPPYAVSVIGTVIGCTPGSTVNIQSVQNTQPAINIDVPLNANCGFQADLIMDSYTGWFAVTTQCGGALQSASGNYTANSFGDSAYVFITIDCGNTNVDCMGIVGGSALPGTPCSDNDPNTVNDVWSANCQCGGTAPSPCQACFTVSQGANGMIDPWNMLVSNCTYGGVSPYTYTWLMPDGSVSTAANPTFEFTAAGTYGLCLTIADASGCSSVLCDTVIVDASGTINPTNLSPCQAGFWVFQAYTGDSLNGTATPIPNELWIWNLSSGGTGNYQFVWDFGDGSISSDEFPTHFYPDGGPYLLCLTMYDGSCTSTACDSIAIDGDGLYTGMILEENFARSGFTVNVLQELPTGMGEQPAIANTALYPNPVAESMNLTFNTTAKGTMPMSIIDLNGRTLTNSTVRIASGANRIEVPVNDLAPGIYMVRFGTGSDAVSLRFVKR